MSDLISKAALLKKLMSDADRIFPDPMTDTVTRHQIIQLIKAMPSVEPEIIHCTDCKYAHLTYSGECKYCDKWLDDDEDYITLYLDGDFYCGFAERKEK